MCLGQVRRAQAAGFRASSDTTTCEPSHVNLVLSDREAELILPPQGSMLSRDRRSRLHRMPDVSMKLILSMNSATPAVIASLLGQPPAGLRA